MITKRGIYYDLNDSTYTLKVEGLTFYFSSEFYRMKFAESFVKYIESETLKLKVKYSCNIKKRKVEI